MKPLFGKGPYIGYRFLICLWLSVGLLLAEYRWQGMAQVRSTLTIVVTPLQWSADLPGRLWGWGVDLLSHRNALLEENETLKSQVLLLSKRVERMAALAAENVRLRELLHAVAVDEENFITAELIGLDADPFTHQVVINRGREDGVYVGQPVIDATGLMGQVISVAAYTSRVLLVADASHAVPVQINRNGLRLIALGTGAIDELRLAHVPDTADIEENDLLVTSGLGGRFPVGYPVAQVTHIQHDPGQPFAIVSARPLAQLDRSRYLLLLFPNARQPWQPDACRSPINSAQCRPHRLEDTEPVDLPANAFADETEQPPAEAASTQASHSP
nr:rod shape-determining protein MreC [Allopseudospirillum japonicum]